MNDTVDTLAKLTLVSATSTGNVIDNSFPFKFVLRVGVSKVMGSLKTALERSWGRDVARKFYDSEQIIIMSVIFYLVWWHGFGKVMANFPKMYGVWLTEFCATRLQLSYRDHSIDPTCPHCLEVVKDSFHITRCHHCNRAAMLQVGPNPQVPVTFNHKSQN